MRLAVVTPLDSRTTGVADYSLDLLPHLAAANRAPLDVFSDGIEDRSGPGWVARPIGELRDRADQFDLIIYQMGNSPAHDFMADLLFAHPGLVVLHDVSLHYFFARQARARHLSRYQRAMGYGYGVTGADLGRRFLREFIPVDYPDYLVSEWLIDRSPGVIVHSDHAWQMLSARCPTAHLCHIPMPIPLPPLLSSLEARERLGLAVDTYLLGVFGVLNHSKNPAAILDAVQHLIADEVPVKIVFIGQENDTFHLAAEVQQRGLDEHVISLGFVEDPAVVNLWMAAVDVAIGLRSLYWGETPSSTLRLMAAGLPVIVNEIGAFAELPAAACVKLAPDDADSAASLTQALKHLFAHPEQRLAMSYAARDYVMRFHDPADIAQRYLSAVESILRS